MVRLLYLGIFVILANKSFGCFEDIFEFLDFFNTYHSGSAYLKHLN